jgi:predicted  nucleic acid-binding Zn-ribbon protein
MIENNSLLELLQRFQATLERIERNQEKMTTRLEEIGLSVAEISSDIQTLERKLLRPRME